MLNLIHPEELQEALRIAKESQEPVGKILLTLGYLDEPTLQTVLLAQSLIAEGVADQPTAIAAIKVAREKGITLPQALQEAESSEKSEIDCAELDRLIVVPEWGPRGGVCRSEEKKQRESHPAGTCPFLMSSITFKNLNLVLECVALVRSGRLTEEESVQALTLVQSNGIELDEALKRIHVSPGTTRSRIELGDILTAAKFVNERDNIAAVERALLEKRLLGDVLVESGLVAKDFVQVALTLQNLVARGVVDRNDAVKVLRRITDEKRSFIDVADEMKIFQGRSNQCQSGIGPALQKWHRPP